MLLGTIPYNPLCKTLFVQCESSSHGNSLRLGSSDPFYLASNSAVNFLEASSASRVITLQKVLFLEVSLPDALGFFLKIIPYSSFLDYPEDLPTY